MAKKNSDTATTTAGPAGDVIDELIRDGKMARDELQVAHSRTLIGEFVNQVEPEQVPANGDLAALVLKKIADIDKVLSEQVNEILHAEAFQKLEGSWRGLNYLVSNTETSARMFGSLYESTTAIVCPAPFAACDPKVNPLRP